MELYARVFLWCSRKTTGSGGLRPIIMFGGLARIIASSNNLLRCTGPFMARSRHRGSTGDCPLSERTFPKIGFLFFAFPHDPAEIDLTGKQYARGRCRLDKELVTVDPETAPLLCAIPILVP